MKTASERKALAFWNITDIQTVFKVPYKVAKKAYRIAEEIDRAELGPYRVYDTRVRRSTVERIMGTKNADLA